MHWKIARDPFYRPLHEAHGEALVAEAGFFEDTATTDAALDDLTTLCTPTTRITERLAAAPSRPAVLVCTGSFCPVHTGHLAMMEAAREAAERAGFSVVGGYLSPGHDEYITLKLGAEALSASHRLALCGAAVSDSDWLMVDPWEALHRDVAVNFTDVLARLTAYLHHHIRPDLAVFYVCGGDNARFALSFATHGRCIVVDRPGSTAELTRYRSHPLLGDPDRFLWADAAHTGSSTAARQGDHSVLPEVVAARLDRARPTALTLRLEDARVAWGRTEALATFQRGLLAALSPHFTVRTVSLASQRIPPATFPILSLDPLLPGDLSFAVSRRFDLGGTTRRGHVARPDALDLAEQCAAIPSGTYTLFDDDICTGSTVRFVQDALPTRVRIAGVSHLATAGPPGEHQEIADGRDFLLGSMAGGLVVALPDGTLGRAPYALPYVDPGARASLPAAHIHTFSRTVWRLNADFFANSGLTVADLPPAAGRLMRCAGWSGEDALEAVCLWHVGLP
ncbi:MAG: nicotinic acid mononucleotide adenylyltransferase [Myxococcota bacterium]|jgi:nicotinic acid mononucleotide adenylyltransferase